MNFPAPIASAAEMKRLRLLHNMSQDDLAEALGAARETVSRVESGKRPLTLLLARYLALVFERLDKKAPAAAAKPTHKTLHYKKTSYYNFALTDGTPLKMLADVDALPPGTRYRVQENLSGVRTCIRGTGSRHDDELVE